MKRRLMCLFSMLSILLFFPYVCTNAAHGEFLNKGHQVDEYDYSVVFVPDTQVITYWNRESLHCIYDWIVDNAEEKKIKFVVGLGDITEKSTYIEFDAAKAGIDKLNGVVPYCLVRGNHDKTLMLNKYFPKDEMPHIDGTYDSWINNSWREVRMGDLDYLIITLDYGAEDPVLEWAGNVIAEHPDHNVIIATHSYLFNDGTTLDAGDLCPPSLSGGYNDGDDMWKKLVSKYNNIVLVVCGHDASDRIVYRQDKGEHGNTVTQMLIDGQNVDRDTPGGAGLIAIAYFSNGGKTVQMEYYSTIRKQWFMEENQFRFELDVIPAAPRPENGNPYSVPLIIAGVCIVAAAGIFLLTLHKKKRRLTNESSHNSL